MGPFCVNNPPSLICLPSVPQLELGILLDRSQESALDLWRARPGEIFTVQAPDKRLYRARLENRSAAGSRMVPFEALSEEFSATTGLTVYQAIPARERFELVLQKLTELGADRIVPMVTARSINAAERDRAQAKSHKWPDILLRAARQCRRATIPELLPEWSFEKLVSAPSETLRLLLWEKEKDRTLRSCLTEVGYRPVELFVGPEGGFAESEVRRARELGLLPASLGGMTLRTETAAIVGAALIQYERGRLG